MAKKALVLHASLEGGPAKPIPGQLKGVELPALTWRDGTPLNEDELKVLITALRDESAVDHTSPLARKARETLDDEAAAAWSKVVHETWRAADEPAAHKWMLLQARVMASPKDILDMVNVHSWRSLVSGGGWSKATWYLDVIASIGPHTTTAKLFFGFLVEGKLYGTIQHAGRHVIRDFARHEGCSPEDYLISQHLIGVALPTGALPFKPGETTLEGTAHHYTVTLDRGQLLFTDARPHRSHDVPDDLSAEDAKRVATWNEALERELTRWGAYLLFEMQRQKPMPLKEIQQTILSHPIGSAIASTLIWRDDAGRLVRLDGESAFDASYDEVTLGPDTPLVIQNLAELDRAVHDAWVQHLIDEEIILPFDMLKRDTYITRIKRLLESKQISSDAIDALPYHHGFEEGGGSTFFHYRTLPQYNTRIFLQHSGWYIPESYWTPDPPELRGLRLEDLVGNERSLEDVFPGVLSAVCEDLEVLTAKPQTP